MLTHTVDITVVIPTINRPRELAKCVHALGQQTLKPKEIIIIDDGDLPATWPLLYSTLKAFNGMSVRMIKKGKKGLSEARNRGAREACYPWILYLDDDIEIEPNFIFELWKNRHQRLEEPFCAGFSGIVSNARAQSSLERLFNRLFFLNPPGAHEWDITPTGYQTWNPFPRKGKAYYVNGGLSLMRRSLILKFPFIQLVDGRSPQDDVIFCAQLKRFGYYFWICPSARAYHSKSPTARDSGFTQGFKEGKSQRMIYDTYFHGHHLMFYWSSAGWVLRQVFALRIFRALGMIVGYMR